MPAKTSKKSTTKLKATKKRPLSKWVIFGGVAAVAIIGVAIVRFSSASTITFLHGIDKMSSNGKGIAYTAQYGDTKYARPYPEVGYVNTIVSKTDTTRTLKFCAKIKNYSNVYHSYSIYQMNSNYKRMGKVSTYSVPGGAVKTICTPKEYNGDSIIQVNEVRASVKAITHYGVAGFYGTK